MYYDHLRSAQLGPHPLTTLERMTAEHALPAGLDYDSYDQQIRPQDDLFRHVNGPWIANTEIPADKSSYGSFHLLVDEAEAAVREILETEAAQGTPLRKAQDAYAAFMDEDRLRELGTTPIDADIASALAAEDLGDFLRLLGAHEQRGGGGFFGMYVSPDAGDPQVNALYVSQSGLSLPDESYYREEQYAPIREQFVAHIERMLQLVGVDEPAARAEQILRIETEIAAHHWDVVKSREADLTYNPMPLEQFLEPFGELPMRAWLDQLQAPEGVFDRPVVCEPSFVTGLATLLTPENLPAWCNWLMWRIVLAHAALLTPEISAANFEFFGTVLTGVPQQRERWKRGIGHVEGMLGEVIGEAYVARHFKPPAKASMDALVADLVAAYRESITTLGWMSEDTKQRALAKLDKFYPKIGYPPKWLDYSALEIHRDDVVGNAHRSAAVESERHFARVGQPVDKDLWLMTPQTVNAYYMPTTNEIAFPAAILQLPFFDEGRDAAANYGAIGAVIGHEIGHGFDDQGSKYDGDGRLQDWWTDADRQAFEAHTRSLIEQYSVLTPQGLEGETVNGELTIGENIGDLGGLGIAWKAYLIHIGGAEQLPKHEIDGVSAAKRFFLAWAEAWREQRRPEFMKMLLAVDPHSPAEFRCNQIVRNLQPFYDAFSVTEADALWLEPSARVEIW